MLVIVHRRDVRMTVKSYFVSFVFASAVLLVKLSGAAYCIRWSAFLGVVIIVLE